VNRPVVLNTRPRAQAELLSDVLRQAGFEPLEAPAIEIVPVWDTPELAAARRDLQAGLFDWVILPSQNAGRPLVDDLGSARLVCGMATAHALGLRPAVDLVLIKFSAEAALEALGRLAVPGQRVLLPRAAEGRDELLQGLVLLRLEVTAPVVYRTDPVSDAALRLQMGGIDVVTLCSPSAASSVASAVPDDVLIVCLGETTADAARQARLRVDAVATRTTMVALVDAVRVALAAREVPA
jgi:uroporphyrinogen-III synthase/uroporphyrinogen III methyltransferase/synthase